MKHPVISNEAKVDVLDILSSGELQGFTATPEGYMGGKWVQCLEGQFKTYFDVKYAITLNSATAALHAALIASGVGLGDEVIVTPFSFSASASCVLMVGATPVFVDIELDTFCMNPELVKKAVTEKTKAIIPVHLFGHPVDIDAISEAVYQGDESITIIEDVAQAIGATYSGIKVGTWGDCGIFSFNQPKHISSGEGGMLITDDDSIAERVMAIRNHGEVANPSVGLLGYNYRMCEIEACLASHQFKELDNLIVSRNVRAMELDGAFANAAGATTPVTKPNCRHAFYLYAVKKDSAITILNVSGDRLWNNGYCIPLHYLPIFAQFGKKGDFPVTESMWEGGLAVTKL